MSNDTIIKALYAQQRAQILHMKIGSNDLIDDAYAFAWCNSIYPVDHDGDCSIPDRPHENFKDQFIVSGARVEEISGYMDELWNVNNPTFDVLETQFGRDSRSAILKVARYFYLLKAFDDVFWSTLSAGRGHGIDRIFSKDDLYL